MTTPHSHNDHDHDHDHKHEHKHHHEDQHHAHDHSHDDHDACCSDAPSHLTPASDGIRLDSLPAGTLRSQLRIDQMDCPTEETLIRKRLGGMASVYGLEFNLMQRVLTIAHAPDALPSITAAIAELGMQAKPVENATATDAPPATHKPWWPLLVALLLAIGAEVSHWLTLPEWLGGALAASAILLAGTGTYRKGWIAIRQKNLNINALMSIAVTGALALQQWPEAAMVMVLFAIAEVIEARSLDRARNAIQGLLQLVPALATVHQTDGSWQDMAVSAVATGARVRVKPGERIALDGVVVAGASSVNQAPITGESMPVLKAVGDGVFAGTINESGSLEFEVSAAANDSTLARIIHAIEEAQASRAPTQRFVDTFSAVYTPAVVAFAALVAILPPLWLHGGWHEWIYRALVLLVIACPCALVISTPITIVSGLAAAARRGILIKGGVHLEEGRLLHTIAFDKTGTITHGKPALTDTVLLSDTAADACMQLAASLAARSDHPVSRAIATAADAQSIPTLPVEAFSAITGRGVQGSMQGRLFRMGNHRLIHETGFCSDALEQQLAALESQGKTVIGLADDQKVLAVFAVADTVKQTSIEAIQALNALGLKTVMLTGDNIHTAQAIAAQVNIDDVRGDLLPEDKLQAVTSLEKNGRVGVVGDGINDGPALAKASVGIAMGAMGSDTAIETADVVLMDDDLRKVTEFVRLSHRTHAILLQNIALALGIKAIFLVITLLGFGTMWMAVFADMGASLLVVGNGLRMIKQT